MFSFGTGLSYKLTKIIHIMILGADYMRRAGPVSRAGLVCWDLGTSVKHTKNQLCDYMEKSQPG